jgi:hypothetical protein
MYASADGVSVACVGCKKMVLVVNELVAKSKINCAVVAASPFSSFAKEAKTMQLRNYEVALASMMSYNMRSRSLVISFLHISPIRRPKIIHLSRYRTKPKPENRVRSVSRG